MLVDRWVYCRGPVVFFFFFFQAEDGIRDLTVTGVQTCALPIWLKSPIFIAQRPAGHLRRLAPFNRYDYVAIEGPGPIAVVITRRSEERRVGKERRSRG